MEIKIFSINGQAIKSYHHQHASAGHYTVVWDGKDDTGLALATGLYIYRVCHANSTIVKKMMYVK